MFARLFNRAPRERARLIFRYWAGDRWVSGDPFEIRRRLDKAGGGADWLRLGAAMSVRSLDKLQVSPELRRNRLIAADEARAKVVAIARAGFAVGPPAWSEPVKRTVGLTEEETLDTLNRFLRYMEESRLQASFFFGSPGPAAPSESPTSDTAPPGE